MAVCLFGVETEYAINGMWGQEAVERQAIVRRLLELAHGTLPHVRDNSSSGLFLENAARLYVDCGLHLEYATPEVSNPWDAVRYVEAGHKIVMKLIQSFTDESAPEVEANCYRVNVDYSGSGSTWGCHESYLHRMPPEDLPPQLIPHLVSRIIYTGAGGFDPLSGGLRFTLSPRAAHIERTVSNDSTSDRGIFHTKDESLCTGYHRLHILCGESLCSQVAMFLKFGATCLVVAMAEAGLEPGNDVQLASPLAALRTVAGDPTCKRLLKINGSSGITAIDIQRHYLAMAEAHLGESFMPTWAPIVCQEWRRVVDLLEMGPVAAVKALDWATKLQLYADHASRLGLNWNRFSFWTIVIDHMRRALGLRPDDGPLPLDLAIGAETPLAGYISRIDAVLRKNGLQWEELRKVLALRAEFLEIDMRFGQLGPQGLFTVLDDAGVLEHRIGDIDSIDHAMRNPPASGRAKVRGAVVKRVAGDTEGAWRCDWERIVSQSYGKFLDLSDPFAQAETWYDEPIS